MYKKVGKFQEDWKRQIKRRERMMRVTAGFVVTIFIFGLLVQLFVI